MVEGFVDAKFGWKMASSNHNDPMEVDAVQKARGKAKHPHKTCASTAEKRAIGPEIAGRNKQTSRREKAKVKRMAKQRKENRLRSGRRKAVTTATSQRTGNEVQAVFSKYVMMLESSSGQTALAVDGQCSLETLNGQEFDWAKLPEVSAVNSEFDTLWLDSANFTHVCLLEAFTQFPLEPPTSKHGVWAANGQELKHYGQRKVQLTIGNAVVDAVFQVLDVSGALLSVCQMTEKGWKIQFNCQRHKLR